MSLLGSIFGSLISGAFGIGATSATNKANKQMQADANQTNLQMNRETNEANLKAVRETNAQQKLLAELAYQRSLPTAQLRDLMAAGLSKQAALQSLTGGTYTMPTLSVPQQTAGHVDPARADYSGLAAVGESLANIPSNVMQYKMQEKQMQLMDQQLKLQLEEEKRKTDLHQYNLWKEQYGKETAVALDKASNIVSNALLNLGRDINEFKSVEHMISQLGLKDDPSIKNMPYIARQQMEDSIRTKFAEGRAQRQQDNADTAASDLHAISQQQLSDLRARSEDYAAEKNARRKEYKLRELYANIEEILQRDNLSLVQYQHDLEFNEDGTPKFSRKVSERAKRAWDRLADTIGIGVLKDLIRGMVQFAK